MDTMKFKTASVILTSLIDGCATQSAYNARHAMTTGDTYEIFILANPFQDLPKDTPTFHEFPVRQSKIVTSDVQKRILKRLFAQIDDGPDTSFTKASYSLLDPRYGIKVLQGNIETDAIYFGTPLDVYILNNLPRRYSLNQQAVTDAVNTIFSTN